MTLLILTGASKGLGFDLLKVLLDKNVLDLHVIGLSRTSPGIEDSAVYTWIPCDLSAYTNLVQVLESQVVGADYRKVIFVNNAGDINPLQMVGNFSEQSIERSIQVNILAPVAISNWILSFFKQQPITLLNISSGAATRPIIGWGAYCSAKAYMKMFFDVAEAEAKEWNRPVSIVHINPGVMDTGMQQDIRSSTIDSEQNKRLRDLYQKGELKSSAEVAADIFSTHILPVL